MMKLSIPSVGGVRLLPALIATGSVVFALKAATLAAAAAEAADAAPAAEPAGENHATAEGAAKPAEAAAQCAIPSFAEQAGLSATEVEVLQSLGARRTALDARETDMSTQAQLIEASQTRRDERLAELKTLQTSVEALLGKLDEEQNARINGLVTVYSKMKLKDAAAIF